MPVFVVSLLAFAGGDSAWGNEEPNEISECDVFIEINATDEDAGWQGIADASPWKTLWVLGPGKDGRHGKPYLKDQALGPARKQGMTEKRWESAEPTFDEFALEDFLENWPGALIVVSHDRAFLERTVDDVVVMDGHGHAGRYPGGYAAWESEQHLRGTTRRAESASAQAARSAPEATSPPGTETSSAPGPTSASTRGPKAKPKRSSSTIGHELRQVDKAMAKLQRHVDGLNQQLIDAGTDHHRLSELGAELSARQAELDETEERWLELSEELESR